MKVSTKILFGLLVLCLGFLGLIVYKLFITDNLVHWAKELHPLGKNQIYVIEKNGEINHPDGSITLSAEVFYTFTPKHENAQSPTSSGRQIGSTTVDLEKYLGQEVYIYGYFSRGKVMFLESNKLNLTDVSMPDALKGERVVLNVQNVELVEAGKL